jgi:hypothetical protein
MAVSGVSAETESSEQDSDKQLLHGAPPMENLGRLIFELEAGIQAFLCYRYWRTHRRDTPAFVAFLGFGAVMHVVMFLLFHFAGRRVYSYAFWYERAAETIFLLVVVFEILASPKWQTRSRTIALAIGAVLIAAQVLHFRLWFDAAVTAAACLPLFVLLWRGHETSPRWWIAAGFVTFAVSTSLVQFLAGRPEYRYLGTYCYLIAQTLWIRGSFVLPSSGRADERRELPFRFFRKAA